MQCDKLELLLFENGYKYYLFKPTLFRLFPKSGNMRKMTVMQKLRFLIMKKNGCRIYILTDDQNEVLASLAFSSGAQYRFPFSTKDDLIYGPSYTIPEYRGKGYASQLADKILSTFETNYKNVYGTVTINNVASLKCMAKSGFENVGMLRASKITRAFKEVERGDHYLLKYENSEKNKKRAKICLISSSGGHFEQLKMLKKLGNNHDIYIVTEKTEYREECNYTLFAGNKNKLIYAWHLFLNIFYSLKHLLIEKPDVVISTGTMVAFPTIIWARLFRKKVIYIETFARVHGGTRAGKFVYNHKLANMFIYQWESLKEEYPEGVYGGGIY